MGPLSVVVEYRYFFPGENHKILMPNDACTRIACLFKIVAKVVEVLVYVPNQPFYLLLREASYVSVG